MGYKGANECERARKKEKERESGSALSIIDAGDGHRRINAF